MIRIEEYKDEYLIGVIDLLKRNFPWMRTYSDATINKWLNPIINYRWEFSDITNQKIAYSRGMVLIDKEDNVVGFNGLIISKQVINGKEYICGNLSTTAIDPKYRIQVYSMFSLAHEVCDIVSSYSPIEVNQKIEESLFKYKRVDKVGYKFLPIPLIRSKKVKIEIITDSSQISQKDLQRVYEDHKVYGVRCACISAEGTICYLFYRVMVMKFGIGKYRCIRVLYSSDPDLCGKYARDIVWSIEKREKALLEADSRFLGGEQINYKLPYFKRKRVRLEKNFKDDEQMFPYGLLYSEQSILIPPHELND